VTYKYGQPIKGTTCDLTIAHICTLPHVAHPSWLHYKQFLRPSLCKRDSSPTLIKKTDKIMMMCMTTLKGYKLDADVLVFLFMFLSYNWNFTVPIYIMKLCIRVMICLVREIKIERKENADNNIFFFVLFD